MTLEVTPEQAERVAVAERLGRLVLTVRSIDAEEAVTRDCAAALDRVAGAEPARAGTAPVMFGSDVSAALSRDEPTAVPRMRVIQGEAVSDVVFR